MKNLITLFTFFILSAGATAQYVNIPDSTFREILRYRYPQCFDAAGLMDTTCTSITNEESLIIEGYYRTLSIENLSGLRYFKNLKLFTFHWDDYITSIDELPQRLRSLYISGLYRLNSLPVLPDSLEQFTLTGCAGITNLPNLPNSIKRLTIHSNTSINTLPQLPDSLIRFELSTNYAITNIPALPAGLRYLGFSSNINIGSLPALPASLDTLECPGNRLTGLPALPSGLSYINCSKNNLINLGTLPLNLKYLNCNNNNELAYLPGLPTGLKELQCENDSGLLSNLPTLPDSLQTLNCYNNRIESLPALPAHLTFLNCSGNRLTTLPELPASLVHLYAHNNRLRGLPQLPNGLGLLAVDNNPLYHLPTLPDSLTTLFCGSDSLYDLPGFPQKLVNVICINNLLTSLPALPNERISIYCTKNNITCLPVLPPPSIFNTVHITLDEGEVKCLPNFSNAVISFIDSLTNFTSPHPPLPLCNPTNNANRCQSFPIISGSVFYDLNNNNIKDPHENYKSGLKLELSNGSFAYSNNYGYFEIGADNLGTYTITPTAPDYYNIVPSSVSYNFTTYDTVVSQNFALQASMIKDSLVIKLTPLNRAARPGFSFPYGISYENAGTTTLSPNIVFNYDDTRLTYDSSSNAAVINNGNNLALHVGNFVPGQQESFTAYFTVKPTVAIDDSLFAKATINDNATLAADSSKVFIRGSYDPNDKQATPELSPLQVANGTYIDYTIRFQNTGTDTAFNIVISDTLAAQLLVNTLQVTATSHPCKTTVKDNIVCFELLDILLPDSNTNEAKSHGFVSFRIKPHPSVPSGETINNNAAIYFDYNAPVITNTAATFIKPFTIIPVKLISFSAVPQNDNTVSLNWNTANEINTHHFVIERSNDGLRFNAVTNVMAKGRTSNNYYAAVADANTAIVFYRLKIVDRSDSFVYSPVIKIDKRKNTTGISVLSNPVKDVLIISTTDRTLNNTPANIFNMQGAVVKTFIVKEGGQTVELTHLPSGIYYLRTINASHKLLIL